MHLDLERLQRLLDGELTRAEEATAREHMLGCAECRGRLDRAQREAERVDALLRLADVPPLPVHARAFAEEARGRARGALVMQRAAAILLALGIAGVAYAVYAAPGSPVRAWWAAIAHRIGGEPRRAPSTPSPRDVPRAGIAVAPGRDFAVEFTFAQAGGGVVVSLTDGSEVVVRGLPGAASYTSDTDRIVIDNRVSSATFQIEIPHTAPRVEIRVGGERIFLKEGAHVSGAAAADSSALYHLQLTPP
jgi:hypothetical protein